jgi:hypothetical protein
MKSVMILMFLLATMPLQANETFKATVKGSVCIEVDPFVVGDTCLLSLEKSSGEELTLVLDFDEFQASYEDQKLYGRRVEVRKSLIKKITKRDVLEVLKDYAESEYYSATLKSFKLDDKFEQEPMYPLIAKYRGFIHLESLPAGYSGEVVKKLPLNAAFRQYLKNKTALKQLAWKDLVLNSGEYDYLGKEQKAEAIANPAKYLDVDHILQIQEVYKVYKNGKHIGYFVNLADHVQAAIYQDGAWSNLFLDENLEVLAIFDESA